jgi:hypothetical protein
MSGIRFADEFKRDAVAQVVDLRYGVRCRRRRCELRACSRTLGYFTPVHERGPKWVNIEEGDLCGCPQFSKKFLKY